MTSAAPSRFSLRSSKDTYCRGAHLAYSAVLSTTTRCKINRFDPPRALKPVGRTPHDEAPSMMIAAVTNRLTGLAPAAASGGVETYNNATPTTNKHTIAAEAEAAAPAPRPPPATAVAATATQARACAAAYAQLPRSGGGGGLGGGIGRPDCTDQRYRRWSRGGRGGGGNAGDGGSGAGGGNTDTPTGAAGGTHEAAVAPPPAPGRCCCPG